MQTYTPPNDANVLTTNQSKTNPDKTYYIVRGKRDGVVYCTCPGWRMSSPDQVGGKSCRHLKTWKSEQY